jgi:hypothetical protein
MPNFIPEWLHLSPGPWTSLLAAVLALCSMAVTLRLARYRFQLNSYKAETERMVALRSITLAERQISIDEKDLRPRLPADRPRIPQPIAAE